MAPNTPFENLPSTYECSVCEAPKHSFEKKTFQILLNS
ncbi:rubredoxin [Jejuia pallidilutea]